MRVVVFILSVGLAAVCGDSYHPEYLRRAQGKANLNPNEATASFWVDEAQAAIKERLERPASKPKARNIIMFLGDGMSVPTLAAARTLKGQRNNQTGEEAKMFFETFPTVGLAKTYCVDEQIADSACTATAYLCGIKNNYGTTGVTAAVPRHDCLASTDPATHVESIGEWALASGKDVGIVTTTRITHASPSGVYAKVANRGWERNQQVVDAGHDPSVCPDIADQLINFNPGKQIKVILGGGSREFLPNTTAEGLRTDGRNLLNEWAEDKDARNLDHNYIWNRSQLMNLMSSPPDYLLGLFDAGHLPYHMEADKTLVPTLAEMTEMAIRSLNRNEEGFFLFVESGRIDHAHHGNLVHLALDETLEMDLAIEKAIELLGVEDTLMVVTADHAHVMTINGYTSRGTKIIEASETLGDDDVPYMTLSYANGPGARTQINNTRIDVTEENDYLNLRWKSHAEVILEDETHGGDDVAVFAIGPHHHMFTGLYEQSQIPHLMAYASCIGHGLQACSSASLIHPFAMAFYLLAILLVNVIRL